MSLGRAIKRTALNNAASKRGKFKGKGVTGFTFELENGDQIKGVSSPFIPDLIEDTWMTLLKTDGGWVVQGTASSAPASSVPSGMLP